MWRFIISYKDTNLYRLGYFSFGQFFLFFLNLSNEAICIIWAINANRVNRTNDQHGDGSEADCVERFNWNSTHVVLHHPYKDIMMSISLPSGSKRAIWELCSRSTWIINSVKYIRVKPAVEFNDNWIKVDISNISIYGKFYRDLSASFSVQFILRNIFLNFPSTLC